MTVSGGQFIANSRLIFIDTLEKNKKITGFIANSTCSPSATLHSCFFKLVPPEAADAAAEVGWELAKGRISEEMSFFISGGSS